MAPSRISELASIVARQTAVIDAFFTSHHLPSPTFAIDSPPFLPIPPSEKEVIRAQNDVIAATKELNSLMVGPAGTVMGISPNDCLSLQAVYRYDVASHVPIDGTATYEALSTACGLNAADLRRLVRHAMTNHIFKEQDGTVSHTAGSRLLAENPMVRDYVGIMNEERFPGSARTVDALLKYDRAKDPKESGYTLGHNTDKGLYEYLQDLPDRRNRFAGAMGAIASTIPIEPLSNAFDWNKYSTIVDVGGGWGPVSIGLAKQFPKLNFTVQDIPEVIADAPTHLPQELTNRVKYMVANFMEEQPVKGADIYFFRAIFHNWPDEYCLRILRNQIPALKHGARLLINDFVLQPPGDLPLHLEKRRRSMDLTMLTFFASCERTEEEWKAILHKANPNFLMKSSRLPPNDMHHIVEVVWNGEDQM